MATKKRYTNTRWNSNFLWHINLQTDSFRDLGDKLHVTISSVNMIIYKVTLSCERSHCETHVGIEKPANDPESYMNGEENCSI